MSDVTTSPNWQAEFPEHLRSYDGLVQDVRAQLHGLSNSEKGDRFAQFVQNLVPQSELNVSFNQPTLSEKKSNDEGVDLAAIGKDGISTLYVQSKLWIDRADQIDSILTKFQDYLAQRRIGPNGLQRTLFDFVDDKPVHFLIVTLSNIDGIRKQYERHQYGNKKFYQELMENKRLHFIDGTEILKILRSTYRKVSDSPVMLELNLETPVISKGHVYIGIISGRELKRLYDEFNESLFFENLRGFQGLQTKQGRKTPNIEIVKTITTDPARMLERNNGIVIKAEQVTVDETNTKLKLTKGSVVNGCQTTTCLVSHASDEAYVLVKIVETTDPWDITEAANLQNYVSDIDLTISRTMRSQLAKRAAAQLGVKLDIAQDSAFKLLTTVTQREVVYEETRLIYIGLFSRTPNTIFTNNYTDLRQDIVREFYTEDRYGTIIYEVTFALQQASQESLARMKVKSAIHNTYSQGIERLYGRNPAYRCFIAILTLSAVLDDDISVRQPEAAVEHKRMQAFFDKALVLLKGDRKLFHRYYRFACKVWMDEVMPPNRSDEEIGQYMATNTKRGNFSGMIRSIHRELDLYEQMRKEDAEEA